MLSMLTIFRPIPNNNLSLYARLICYVVQQRSMTELAISTIGYLSNKSCNNTTQRTAGLNLANRDYTPTTSCWLGYNNTIHDYV